MRRALVFVAVLLPSLLAASACGDHPTAADWGGSWREVGTPEAYVLKLIPKSNGDYVVEYPRSFKVPFEARPDDGKLLVWGENTDDIVWTLSLDKASHQLTAVGKQGDTIRLVRSE